MTALALAVGALVATLAVWVVYMAGVPKGNVPERPTGSVLIQIGGLGAAVAGLVLTFTGGSPSAAVIAPASFAVMMSALFLFLLSQRRTPVGNLQIKVGDRLLPFASHSSDGSPFQSDELADRRVLLKFFRGGW